MVFSSARIVRGVATVETEQARHFSFGLYLYKKGKCFSYLLPSIGPGADLGVQAVSPQVGGRLPLLSARLVATFPAAEHHRPLASTKLYCLVTKAHRCEQLAQGCYTHAAFAPSRI